MARIKMLVTYDGTAYRGWQRQPDSKRLNTVQYQIEKALKKLLHQPITIEGSGRTDAGVHALGQVASFQADVQIPVAKLGEIINNRLPEDIRILSCEEVPDAFHPRYDAVGKTYCYNLVLGHKAHAFNWQYAHFCEKILDIAKVEQACEIFCGTHNFRNFTVNNFGSNDQAKQRPLNYERTIYACTFSPCANNSNFPIVNQAGLWCMEITGNGFMYKMVRMITGALLAVGSGRVSLERLEQSLTDCRMVLAPSLPANGLFLKQVYYDQSDLPCLGNNKKS